ncbi:MAG: hypothetical protein KDA92_21230, partial [Planctomycetales bacterium]|nr:hypothetical protein [Planctomycetales bacterium]
AAILPCPTVPPAWEAVTYMWLALPGLAISLIASFVWLRCPDLTRHNHMTRLAAATVVVLSTWALWNQPRSGIWEGLAGNAFLYLAIDPITLRWSQVVARFAPLSYGVYLSHLLFLKVAESAAQKLGWSASPTLDLACFLGAASGSLALSFLLARSRWTRWAIG